MQASGKSSLTRWMWLAAALLMLAEFLVFDRMTSRHHTGIYPRWNDQIQYLTEAYTAYEQMQAHGLAAGLKFSLGKTAVQGTLHDTFALFVFWLVGSASRSAALSLNMLAFLAWQAAVLFAIPRVSGSRALGWMGFGLLLCVAWPWSGEAGSAVDFRLDHAAMCLMGVTSCVALLTNGFRSAPWAVALGVAVGVTLLERFLTGIYFAAFFVATAIWILMGESRWARLRNLLLAGGVATTLALPVFWINRTAIHTYYWVGHVSGAESDARFRGLDVWNSVSFVFGHLRDMHLGSYFGWVVVALTALLLLLLAIFRPRPAAGPGRDWLYFAFAFLLVPAAVLVLHRQKSEYVLGVLVPGVILLALWGWEMIRRRIAFPSTGHWSQYAALLPALVAVSAGSNFFLQRQLHQPHDPGFLTSARTVNHIADTIFASARAHNVANPYIAVDQVVDYLDAQILQVICYERKKIWVPFVIQLPNSILAEKEEVIFYRLQLCDFVMLTDEMVGAGHWPYDQQMRRLYPELKAWSDTHLRLVDTYAIFGRRISLYQKKEMP
ncbi:MAG: hypothetical protein Q8J74_07445 [Candidatus Didemnitutus sp.]|nr:hypothetical protein [Candidatus Didemnitutus sp.]